MVFNEFSEKPEFSTDSNFIKWYYLTTSSSRWVNKLNRNNLILEVYPQSLDGSSNDYVEQSTSVYQCSVQSKDEFWSKLQSLKKSHQKKIINELRDKKI